MKYLYHNSKRYHILHINNTHISLKAILKELDGTRERLTLPLTSLTPRQQEKIKSLPLARKVAKKPL